jgi:hypothetical protein
MDPLGPRRPPPPSSRERAVVARTGLLTPHVVVAAPVSPAGRAAPGPVTAGLPVRRAARCPPPVLRPSPSPPPPGGTA